MNWEYKVRVLPYHMHEDAMNEMGAIGWECFQYYSQQGTGIVQMVFKREIRERSVINPITIETLEKIAKDNKCAQE